MSSIAEPTVFRRRHSILHQAQSPISYLRRKFIEPGTAPKENDNDSSTKHRWNIREIRPEEEPEFWASSPSRRRATRLSHVAGAVPFFLFLWSFVLQVQYLSHFHMVPRAMICMEVVRIVLGIVDCACRLIAAISPVWRPRYRLEGGSVPRIDVIITCCNESLDIIQDTVLGALAVDYPRDSFRVILTDDGASPAVEKWATGLKQPNLYYTARVKQGNGGYKAGNLNHAVAFIKTLPGKPADFIAGLDVDMIPDRNWLRAVIPHLLLDPGMGVVTPAQGFYNIPTGDLIFQSNQIAWCISDFVRDSLGCAWNSGSGYILRRTALDDIGGFSSGSVTEDVYSLMLMLSKGWRTAYLPESLQFGLVPSSYLGHIKQHTRWNIGGIQLGQNFNFYLSKSLCGQLNWKQRLSGFWCLTASYRHALDMLDLLIIPTYWGSHDKTQEEMQMLARFVRISCVANLTHFLHSYGRGWVLGYRNAIRELGLQLYMSPYFIVAELRSFILPRSLGGTDPGFKASGSICDDTYERCASRRSPLALRAKHMILGCGVWYHVLLPAFYLSYITWRARCLLSQEAGADVTYGDGGRVLSAEWIEMSICSTPLRYMLFPPNDPPRDDLMGERDGITGARYSTADARQLKLNPWCVLDFEFFHTVVGVLNIYILVKTWGI
ncbi:glycosyltransferase family 2 protein [Hypoxylon sp. FL1150]|nr:glycosyltransferase family 2 protein [Hypoxylon sp. FL1150]